MLVATLIVLLLILALIFAPMGLTAAKARAHRRGQLGPEASPGHPVRERRTLGRRPADVGR